MNKVIRRFLRITLTLFLVVLSLGKSALAVNGTPVDIRGVIVDPPPCEINNNTVQTIHFGDALGVKKIDGEQYKQAIPLRVNCYDPLNGLDTEVIFKIVGSATSFDTAAVETPFDALGIRILDGKGNPIELNKEKRIRYGDIGDLTAVPVKAPGSELSEGFFSASVTLTVLMQ